MKKGYISLSKQYFKRRDLVKAGLALSVAPAWVASKERMMTKPIPVSGEQLPVIGLGTWRVFDVWGWWWEISARREIVDLMIQRGASVIDTSPKYEPAEDVIGDVIDEGGRRANLFLATKVWADGRSAGEAQMRESADLMGTQKLDLVKVHDLRDVDTQMGIIREWQQDGRVRYNGISEWQASALGDLEAAILKYKPQFIQINYSLGEREAEKRLLPMARDLGIAVMINRPFKHGKLFRAVENKPLPDWASDYAESWGQFFLKFIVSHPAVNCAIAGTSKLHHMADNLGAGYGPMPDAAMRSRMASFFDSL